MEQTEPASSSSSLTKNIFVCGMLLLGVCLVFGQTVRHGFITMDDPEYVYRNPVVRGGLTFRGVFWALLGSHAYNWHPLTWMSHMLDCQCYGLAAGPHHATNVVLHGLSACTLLVLLRRLSGDFWSSAFVAAIFAVHPLHVESVAWVAERKNVLSGLFFFLTLLAYESYVRHGRSTGRYLLATLLFVLGLMAKPMLVTLPLVALLLDYWPLGRFRQEERQGGEQPGGEESASRMPAFVPLLVEKLPWLVLSAVSCAITLTAQREAILPVDQLPLAMRLPNVLTSYAAYLEQAAWPHDLAIFYPHLKTWPPLTALIASTVLVGGISFVALRLRKRCPYLLVGWLWYLGMLVPVIGLVQVGGQAMADRYTYLPLIGIDIAVTWASAERRAAMGVDRIGCAGVGDRLIGRLTCGRMATDRLLAQRRTIWAKSAACTPENSITLNQFAGTGRSRRFGRRPGGH